MRTKYYRRRFLLLTIEWCQSLFNGMLRPSVPHMGQRPVLGALQNCSGLFSLKVDRHVMGIFVLGRRAAFQLYFHPCHRCKSEGCIRPSSTA